MKGRSRKNITRAVLALALALGVVVWTQSERSVSAAGNTITVTNTNDTGAGSLREAVDTLAQNGDTIVFNLSTSDPNYDAATGRWTLKLVQVRVDDLYYDSRLYISRNIRIIGPGADKLTIKKDMENSPSYFSMKLFYVGPGVEFTLSGVTLTSINPFLKEGEGQRTTEMGTSVLLNRSGTVHLSDCVIVDSHNSTNREGYGGAVTNMATYDGPATMTIDNCRFINNQSDRDGAVLLNYPRTGVSGNEAATMRVTNSTFTGNSKVENQSHYFGVITNFNEGFSNAPANLEIENSVISGNNMTAIHDYMGSTIIKNTTISNNLTDDAVIRGDNLKIIGSTFNDNVSGYGGIYGAGNWEIINSTFSNNRSTSSGISGALSAYGTFYSPANLRIKNSTFVNNSAPDGYAITKLSNSASWFVKLEISNSIFKSAAGGANINPAGFTGITSNGYNISDDNFAGKLTGANDQPNTEPLLAPLADNGGPTPTHALLPNSPAINNGSNALAVDFNGNALTTDQRGANRIYGSSVDIGAVEMQADSDSDNVEDFRDNCPTTANPDQTDSDNDGIGDVCEDTTPPVIAPTVSGTLGNNDWYVSDVQVSWTVTDDESTVSSQTGCAAQSVTTDTNGATFTCSANSQGGGSSQSVTVKRDAAAPSITFVSRTAPNAAGWNNTDVSVNWSCADTMSGAAAPSVSQTVTGEGGNLSAVGTCADNAGNAAQNTQSGIRIDKTAPTLNPAVSPNPVLLNGSAAASANATDLLSGIASQSCGSVSTNSVGSKSVNCAAIDNAGNTANANANYRVIYNFAGFFQPIANLPTVNEVNAGQSIPIKFSLNGNQGLNIFAAGYPASSAVPCSASEPGSTVEEISTPGSSCLTYSAGADQYSYVWKTQKAWKNTCRMLVVRFIDGSEYYAKFRFR